MAEKTQSPIIEFPLRGEWKAVNSPGHHRFAFDFAATGSSGKRLFSKSILHYLLAGVDASDFYSWNKPVFTPFACKVIDARDGSPDREKLHLIKDFFKTVKFSLFQKKPFDENDIQSFAGNYVILKSDQTFAFIAHLKCNSVQVEKGESLSGREMIGRIGNSGNSLFPHLHFQLMDGPDLLNSDIIPFRLSSYQT